MNFLSYALKNSLNAMTTNFKNKNKISIKTRYWKFNLVINYIERNSKYKYVETDRYVYC